MKFEEKILFRTAYFRKDIMRYCSYLAIGMSLSLAVALIGTNPTQAQSVGNKDARLSLVAASAPVQSPPICAAYDEFLNGSQPDDISKCSEIGKFLIRNSDLDLLRFLNNYHTLWPQSSASETLVRGLILTLEGDRKIAFAVLDIANSLVYAAYFKIGDIKRAFVYAVLIQRTKIRALRVGLGDNQNFLDAYPLVNFVNHLGPKFAIFDRYLDHPDYSLICLLRADNLQVPVEKVVSSQRFASCIAKPKDKK